MKAEWKEVMNFFEKEGFGETTFRVAEACCFMPVPTGGGGGGGCDPGDYDYGG